MFPELLQSLQRPTKVASVACPTALASASDTAACHPQSSREIAGAAISSEPVNPALTPRPVSESSQLPSSASTSETRPTVRPLGPNLPPFQAELYKTATLRMQFFWFLIARRAHELVLHNTKLLLLGRADLQRTLSARKTRQEDFLHDIREIFDFWLTRKRMWELTKSMAQSKRGWGWREKRGQTADMEEKEIEGIARASEMRFRWLNNLKGVTAGVGIDHLANGRETGEWVPGGANGTDAELWHDVRKGNCTWDGHCECVFAPGGSEIRGPWAWRGTAWGDLVIWLVWLCRMHLTPDVDNSITASSNGDISDPEAIGALDEHGIGRKAKEGIQSDPDVTLKPNLSNLDWTTFCYLFPHTFSEIRYKPHIHPGNPSMNPRVIRPGLDLDGTGEGVFPSIPRHPWLEMRMSVNSNRMNLDNWRYVYLQQQDSVVRSFEEARAMAREVLSKRDLNLHTDLEEGVAEPDQNIDYCNGRRELLAVDEFYPLPDPTLLERSFWRFGTGPTPCFPIGPPPEPGEQEIPQLPPARKVAAYGSLMLHVNAFYLSMDLLWWDAMAAEHACAEGKTPMGPLSPLELIDPEGRLAHGLVVRSLWVYVLGRFGERGYTVEYIQRARRRAERGLGGVDVDRKEDADVGEDGDWAESFEDREEGEDKEEEAEVARLGETLLGDAFWSALGGLEEFRRRWGPQELAFWLRRIEERVFLLLSSFPRGVRKGKAKTSDAACATRETDEEDSPPDEGGLWKFHVPQEEEEVASGARRGVAAHFEVLVLREFPELAWEGFPSWYGRKDLIRSKELKLANK
ncbi:hypothetical protein EV426DRAFT_620144 [Tirmania nivea]|nr:hypothetical protein EV426DRAFT_620144 [Tirmania nivea]